MNYEESLHYLDELNTFGIRLGLTRMEELCARLGHPERSYRVIHIAGTNGKGSVTQMMDAVCRASGIRSGRYLSPHLISYTERMSVGGEEISEEQFAALLTRVRAAADAMTAEGHEHPTQFEALTALAFLYFAEEKVEVAVVETGLGGLLDSTNVVLPELTIITNVAMDHADRCGGTLAGIAEHKAGIIKEGVPVITAAAGEPLTIIAARAEELGADLFPSSPVSRRRLRWHSRAPIRRRTPHSPSWRQSSWRARTHASRRTLYARHCARCIIPLALRSSPAGGRLSSWTARITPPGCRHCARGSMPISPRSRASFCSAS